MLKFFRRFEPLFWVAIVVGLFILVVLGALAARAQEAAPTIVPVTDGAMPWWQQVLIALFIGLGGVVIEFLRRGLTKLFDYFAEKSKLTFLARVDDVMMGVVTSLYNKEVEAVKTAAADNKLTAEEKSKFATIAKDELKSLLGVSGLSKLAEIFGSDSGIDKAIANAVEKAVTGAKIAGAAKTAANAVRATANP